jgi:nucleoside-diphosphate-sugar epimerase
MDPSINNTVGKVMVLGANGRLGRAAVLAFVEAGWTVTAQLRRAPRAPLPTAVQLVLADALNVAALAGAAQGVQVIVNALSPDYTQWPKLLPPITAAAIELAAATGATLMLPGNVYNYGNQLPAVLFEDTPFAATHPKAAQRIALEASLAQAACDRGVRSSVIRAGDFLGDAGTWIDLAIGKGLAKGKFVQIGPTDLAHAWAWLPDLARVFVAVAERRAQLAPFSTLNYAGLTLTGAELQAAFEAALGRPLQRGAFPWPLLRLAAPFSVMLRALFEMRYLWQRPHRLDGQRLQALLGASMPATPLAEVVRQCLAGLTGAPLAHATAVATAAPGTPARPASAGR